MHLKSTTSITVLNIQKSVVVQFNTKTVNRNWHISKNQHDALQKRLSYISTALFLRASHHHLVGGSGFIVVTRVVIWWQHLSSYTLIMQTP
jgi:hypothetical protein